MQETKLNGLGLVGLKDQMLQQELNGYRDYIGQTRYRLVPHLW